MRKIIFLSFVFSLIARVFFSPLQVEAAVDAQGGSVAAQTAPATSQGESAAVGVASSAQAVPGIFSYGEFAATRGALYSAVWPRWRRILSGERSRPFFTAEGTGMNAIDAKAWRNLVAAAKKSDEAGILRMVNAFFNYWQPKSDMLAWTVGEYWSSPEEFVAQRGGDCEDYAVAKYFALRFLGFDADRMRIAVVRRKDAAGHFLPDLHAVLAVKRTDTDTWFILDNNARPRDSIVPHTQYKGRFVPLFSVNENGSWGYRKL